ncbi:MAG: hypothetical protein ACFE9T_15130 [Promethearchaeota archaeon]
MDFNIYKVIFKGFQEYKSKSLVLSFRDINSDKPINVPTQFILKLKKLSENSQNIIYFQNIKEVIIIGERNPTFSYNYYFILLYTIKMDGLKVGYLIGNVKRLGDIVVGIWPLNIEINELSSEKILENYHNLINNPHKYTNICLIDQ